MDARPLLPPVDPAEETLRGLPTWPDAALFRLARGVAGEILRRDLPQPAALPIVSAVYLSAGLPDVFSASE